VSLSRRKLSVNVPCQVAAKMLIFGRPSVKRFALCYRAVVQSVRTYVLSCLSVTLVHCGHTVGRIKMKLGMQVGLGPGHIQLAGNPSPLPKGVQPPIFDLYQLRPNGCMDQDATWHGGRPRTRRLCVRWEHRPSPKRGHSPLPNFRPISIVAKRLHAPRGHSVWR